MNPYLIITALVAVMGAGWGGFRLGVDHQKATDADRQEDVRRAGEEAGKLAANAIAKMKPLQTTIQQEIQREILNNTVYVDCRHSPDGLRLLNAALTGGRAERTGGGQLPPPDAAAR